MEVLSFMGRFFGKKSPSPPVLVLETTCGFFLNPPPSTPHPHAEDSLRRRRTRTYTRKYPPAYSLQRSLSVDGTPPPPPTTLPS